MTVDFRRNPFTPVEWFIAGCLLNVWIYAAAVITR